VDLAWWFTAEDRPVLLAAMSDVAPEEAGLASGLVNTSFMMGGALGLAILASLAASRSASLLASGANQLASLNGGLHAAFLVGALCAAVAATMGYTLLRLPADAPQEAQKAVEPEDGDELVGAGSH
jgi:MFS family permease